MILQTITQVWNDLTVTRYDSSAQELPRQAMEGTVLLLDRNWQGLMEGHLVLPAQSSMIPPPTMAAPIAANEEATVTGDPHVKEADGGHFDFQGVAGKTYNLVNDTGFVLNAKFQRYAGNGNATTMGAIGGMISGPLGTSMIQIDAHSQTPVTVNGASVNHGKSVQLADGGLLSVSQDGRTISMTTREGYQNTVTLQGGGEGAYLDYAIKSGTWGVNHDGRMPGGLVGHTFDGDGKARDGRTGGGAQGEGAIDGVYTDYEVPGGLMGLPQLQIMKPGAFPEIFLQDPLYAQYFGLPMGTSSQLVSPDHIQELWNQVANDTLTQQMKDTAQNQYTKGKEQTQKLEMLLMLALNSGNLDLAMMLISGLESQKANELASHMVSQIKKKQDERKSIVDQIGDPKNKNDGATIQKLNLDAGDKNTEINMLQTFIQELMAQKHETQQLTSNYLKSKHDVSQAILRNIG